MSFGQLRSLLQRPADDQLWAEIITLLASQPAQEREQVSLPYVLAYLERWPLGQRSAPAWARAELYASSEASLNTTPYHWLWSLIDAVEISYQTDLTDEKLINLAQDERMAQMYKLSLEQPNMGVLGLEALARSPYLDSLRSFELNKYYSPAPGWSAALAAAPWLPQLHRLCLSSTMLEPWQLQALVEPWSAHAVAWRELDLSDNPSLGADLSALCDHEPWLELKRLNLSGCRGGSASNLERLHFSAMPHLESLNLASNGDISESLREAASLTEVSLALEALELGACELDASSLECFAQVLVPGALKRLSLDMLRFSGELFELLNDHPAFSALEELNLQSLASEPAQLSALFVQPALLGRLKRLNLSYNTLDGELLASRLSLAPDPVLEELLLTATVLKAQAINTLFERGGALPLRRLDLRGSSVKDEHLQRILNHEQWPDLESLNIFYGSVSVVMLYRLGLSPRRSLAFRLELRRQLLRRPLTDALAVLAQRFSITATGKTKRELVEALAQASDAPQVFASLLCSPELIACLNTSELRATLRACGERGYSKLSAVSLKTRVCELLEGKPQALLDYVEEA